MSCMMDFFLIGCYDCLYIARVSVKNVYILLDKAIFIWNLLL